ncbi:glycosyltransferase [Luteimicrobium sp. DT211]|uniref:glycosyltransferase n=1 Tax=Luteimicrobium sp. DT211 TaxID=3393412 RepID=UPI003CFB9B34
MSASPAPAGVPSGALSLVVVSLEPWDEVWRRNQYLVSELLRGDPSLRVLFVEPPSDLTYAALRRTTPRPGRGLRRGPELDGVGPDRLWLYEPTKTLPRRVAPHYDEHRAARILRAARHAGLERPTLWINDAGVAPLLDAGFPVLYDVTDDWLAADRPPAERDRLRRDEAAVLARAGAVTVCSPALALSKGAKRPAGMPPVTLVTNGVDVERYRTIAARPHDLPPGRTAVYVGTLHPDRLDITLCVATSEAMDGDGTVVLVGPVALDPDDVRRLREAGVVLLGPRPRDAVPAYLQHADVLVVPHVVDAFTDSLDPIKLYEYLAVGRPVVSTPVAGFRDTGGTVEVAKAEDFPDAVVGLVRAPRVASGEAPGDLPTWTRQAGLFRAALDGARTAATGGVA